MKTGSSGNAFHQPGPSGRPIQKNLLSCKARTKSSKKDDFPHTRRLLKNCNCDCGEMRQLTNAFVTDPQSLGVSVDEAFLFWVAWRKQTVFYNLASHNMFFDDQISSSRVAGQ